MSPKVASKSARGGEISRRYADGELICREGESSSEMFVVQRGCVRIFKSTARGELELSTLSKGDFFGEMSVLENLPRDASAQAQGEAEVLVMTSGALLVRLRRDPTFSFELLRRLSGRVRTLNARLVDALAARGEATEASAPMLYRAEREEGAS